MAIDSFDDRYFKDLDNSFKDDILKLTAVDLMMEQVDRYGRNMEVIIKDDTYTLAPIIDFELSFFNDKKFTYFNPYILIKKDIRSLDKFYNKYEEGYKYLEETFKTTGKELLDYMKEEYDITAKRLVKRDLYCTIKRNHNIINGLKG